MHLALSISKDFNLFGLSNIETYDNPMAATNASIAELCDEASTC